MICFKAEKYASQASAYLVSCKYVFVDVRARVCVLFLISRCQVHVSPSRKIFHGIEPSLGTAVD